MEAAYNTIAQALVAICPPGFDEARMVAKVGEDWSEIRYDCTVAGEKRTGVPGDTLVSSTVDDAVHDIHDAWPSEPWSRCTFTLFPDGNFKFDVAYEDTDSAVGDS